MMATVSRPEAPRVKRIRSDSSRSTASSVSTRPGSIRMGDESPRMEPVPSRFLWDVSEGDSVVVGVSATPKMRPAIAVSESPRPKDSFSLAAMTPLELSVENPADMVAEADEYEVVSRSGSEEWTTTVLRGVKTGTELKLEHVGFNLVEVVVDGEETYTARKNKFQVFASDESIVASRLNR